MTMNSGPRALAALTTAAVLALSACGGGDDSSSEDTTSETTSSETTQESTEDSGTEDSETEDSGTEAAEEGAEGTVTATKSGVTFDLPDGWQTFDPSKLAQSSEDAPQALKDMAESSGTSVDQLLQGMAQSVDLMAVGESEAGFAENINVIPNPQTMSEAQLKSSYEQQGGTVSETAEIDTALGAAPTATYTMSGQGQSVRGKVIAVPTDSGSAVITVSTTDAKKSDEVITTIAESIDKA